FARNVNRRLRIVVQAGGPLLVLRKDRHRAAEDSGRDLGLRLPLRSAVADDGDLVPSLLETGCDQADGTAVRAHPDLRYPAELLETLLIQHQVTVGELDNLLDRALHLVDLILLNP